MYHLTFLLIADIFSDAHIQGILYAKMKDFIWEISLLLFFFFTIYCGFFYLLLNSQTVKNLIFIGQKGLNHFLQQEGTKEERPQEEGLVSKQQ